MSKSIFSSPECVINVIEIMFCPIRFSYFSLFSRSVLFILVNQGWPKFDIDSPSTPDNLSNTNSPEKHNNNNHSKNNSKFAFSRWEIETFSQDSGYHESQHQNGGTNSDKYAFRRRKHGWVPSPLAIDKYSPSSDTNGKKLTFSSNPELPTSPRFLTPYYGLPSPRTQCRSMPCSPSHSCNRLKLQRKCSCTASAVSSKESVAEALSITEPTSPNVTPRQHTPRLTITTDDQTVDIEEEVDERIEDQEVSPRHGGQQRRRLRHHGDSSLSQTGVNLSVILEKFESTNETNL